MSADSRAIVVRVAEVGPHPNADRLDIIHALAVAGEGGYPCLVKRGTFAPGDLAVYIPVDLVVPDELPPPPGACPADAAAAPSAVDCGGCPQHVAIDPWSFLGKHRRLKAKKLRGVFSMGLLMSPDELLLSGADALEGADVTERLGIKKYVRKARARRSMTGPGGSYGTGQTLYGVDPAALPPYTDIENLRRFPGILEEDEEVVCGEKIHGACFGAASRGGKLYLRSRKRFIQPFSGGLWADLAARHDLARVLAEFPNIAIYGEAYGYVQDLRYGLGEEQALAIFDARDLTTGRWLDWPEIEELVAKMNAFAAACPGCAGRQGVFEVLVWHWCGKPNGSWSVETEYTVQDGVISAAPAVVRPAVPPVFSPPPPLRLVPLLYRGPWKGLAAMKALAEGLTVIGDGACIREGFVVRPVKSRHQPPLGRVILKLVGEGYLLRGSDDQGADDAIAEDEEGESPQETMVKALAANLEATIDQKILDDVAAYAAQAHRFAERTAPLDFSPPVPADEEAPEPPPGWLSRLLFPDPSPGAPSIPPGAPDDNEKDPG